MLSEGTVASAGEVQVSSTDLLASLPKGQWLAHATTDQLAKKARQELKDRLLERKAREAGIAERPEVRRRIRRMLIGEYLKGIREAITAESVTEADIAAWYDAHRGQFEQPQMMRLSQIVLADQASARAVLAELAGLKAQGLTAVAARFRALARKQSLHKASGRRGGDLGYTKAGDSRVDAALQTAGAALAMNAIGGPVAVGEQWVVLMKTGERRAIRRGINEVQAGLRLRVLMEKRRAAVKAAVDGLTTEGSVSIDRDALDKLRAQAQAKASQERGTSAGATK